MPVIRITKKETEKLIKVLSVGEIKAKDMEILANLRKDLVWELERNPEKIIHIK